MVMQQRPVLTDLEAFCATCPSPEEVSRVLAPLGLTLTFQMRAFTYAPYKATPALPPQYHYSDGYGTEVIYLAGHDANTQEVRLPSHESRFWLFAGANQQVYTQVRSLLALRWRLDWQLCEQEVRR
jgi:hypothetical protein